MTKFRPFMFGCLLILSSVLNACTPPDGHTPIPTAAPPVPTWTPQPSHTPSPTATPEPAPELSSWSFNLDYLIGTDAHACVSELSTSGFVLGAVGSACAIGQGGIARSTIAVPAASDTRVVSIYFTCPGDSECAAPANGDAEIVIRVDGTVLWRARCTAGLCDPLALGSGPVLAFTSAGSTQHALEIEVSPGAQWAVENVQVSWSPVPTNLQGVAYSPYRDCQTPHYKGEEFKPDQVALAEDLIQLRSMGNAIRTYSATGIEGEMPALAHAAGLRVIAGAWLGKDLDRNEEEIAAIIEMANSGIVESVIVGNEVLLRGDLTEAELINYIKRVQDAVDVPVTYAEIGYTLRDHPNVMAAVDYQMIHIYAYWDGVPIENAARHTLDVYHMIQTASGDKPVVIGETGWPASGPNRGSAVASLENQRRFLREFLTLAQRERLDFFYFGTYDELWKTEGGVGPFWGFYWPNRINKFDVVSMLAPLNVEPAPMAVPEGGAAPAPLVTGTPGVPGGPELAVDRPPPNPFNLYTTFGAEDNHFAPSGWMGDWEQITFNACAWLPENPWNERVIEVTYNPTLEDPNGWTGIYWLDPVVDPTMKWTKDLVPGIDLTGFTELRFRARSAVDGVMVKFFIGGVDDAPYPSSMLRQFTVEGADRNGFVRLTTEWQTYRIVLHGADLSHLIDPFGWVVERQHSMGGITFYLDDIQIIKE